jgi:hypothetical protein
MRRPPRSSPCSALGIAEGGHARLKVLSRARAPPTSRGQGRLALSSFLPKMPGDLGWPGLVRPGPASRFFVARILQRDPGFLLFTIGVCAIAATVACFQFAVFMSFLRAGSVIPRALGGDVWVVARGVECFDFPTPIGEDYDGVLVRYLPEATFRRVAFGFTPWRSPFGARSNVAIVGINRLQIGPNEFIVDRSDLRRLDLVGRKGDVVEASVGDTTLRFAFPTDTLPTFLGAPYILADFETSRRLLGMSSTATSYLIANLPHGLPADFDRRRAQAKREFPEVEILTTREFSAHSSAYWQRKTGAGTAILLAAILAGLLMVILLVNSIGRFVQKYQNDLISILGHGGDRGDILDILLLIAGLITTTTMAAALVLSPLAALIAHPFLPWVQFRLADMPTPLLAGLLGFGAAVVTARRAIAAHGPDAVFRS